MMSDYLQLAMIIPFILYQFLNNLSIKNNEAKNIQERINTRIDSVSKYIIFCWIHIAKTMKIVFSNKFTSNEYNNLQKCLKEEIEILSKVYFKIYI